MNRQDSNNPLPLWMALLVLPILLLTVYLQWDKLLAQPTVKQIPPNSTGSVRSSISLSVDVRESLNHRLPGQSLADLPEVAPGLDPEAAREAVQQVENSVYDRATALFEHEPVDSEWAINKERALREMFSMHQGLQRVSINSINCRTSMCRIEVFSPRDTDADFFTAMFYDALTNYLEGSLKAEAAITRRMEQGITSVYVARQGYTLGFY